MITTFLEIILKSSKFDYIIIIIIIITNLNVARFKKMVFYIGLLPEILKLKV